MKAGLIVVAALLAMGTFAGCLGTPETKVVEPAALFTLDLPVHVVTVGFADFDEGALLSKLKQPVHPFNGIRLYTTGLMDREPLKYNVRYMVHEAPAEFGEALAAYATSTATPAQPDGFLYGYDVNENGGRVCQPGTSVPLPTGPTLSITPGRCDDIDVLDAQKMQEWIASNRASFGLEFDDAGYTLFVLDTYTAGLLPQDSYHLWAIDDGTADPYVKNMRAWGGDHDFAFMDVGAAPNAIDIRPWANFSNEKADLVELRDPPVWEFENYGGEFYENLARNVYDAARILWARIPIYPVEYANHYVLPTYIFIDPNAHTNPDSPLARYSFADLEAKTERDTIAKAFQDLAPWAKVDVTIEYRYLPDDDPELARVLEDAKRRMHPLDNVYSQGSTYVDFGIVKRYFRENWDKYAPEVEGARVYPTFAFWLEYPSASLYAYSDGDEVGGSWGVFYNVADAFRCNAVTFRKPVCFVEEAFPSEETFWRLWNAIFVHELGHSFGLTHTHDTVGFDEKGYPTYDLNWLWDSTSSVMTYRHTIPSFNQFDKEWLLRHQAVNLAMPLLSGGSPRANALAAEALDAVRAGDYAHALEDAQAAMAAASAAAPVDIDLGTRGETVTTMVRLAAAMAPDGIYVPPAALWVAAPAGEELHFATLPVEVPEGATAMEFAFRELDAASHYGWYAWLDVVNADGEYVTGAYNNGFDNVVLLNLERCASGCEAFLYSYSGLGNAYEVTVTPYTGTTFG